MQSPTQRRRSRVGTSAAISLSVLTLLACSDVAGVGGEEGATLSFRSSGATRVSGGLSALVIPDSVGGHAIEVQQVDAVFDRITLERARGREKQHLSSSVGTSGSDRRQSHDFRAGAVTVTLPLDSGTVSPIVGEIPPGSYDEIRLDARYVRIRGRHDGSPFDVTVAVNVMIESRLDPPFEPTDSTTSPNITVDVDIASWFRGRDGGVIDPRRLASDAMLRAHFSNRIRASFRCFSDMDRDGKAGSRR